MVKGIFAAALGLCMLISSSVMAQQGPPEVQALRECGVPIIQTGVYEKNFIMLSMEVALECEAEFVMLAYAAGLALPEEQEEYSKAIFDMSAGFTGEILRQVTVYYERELKKRGA